MEIILLQKVDNVGGIGDKVRVKSGYARNFLIPGGLAVPVTQGNRKWINEEEAAQLLQSLIGDQAFVQKLISPTQAAKLTEIDIESLVTREPGKPIYISKN